MKINRIFIAALYVIGVLPLAAAEPSGYYDSCKGKSGSSLLKALEGVIGSHTNVGYKGLWDLYKTSDVDHNGKIWDMYSTKRWRPGSEQCGTYSGLGDCYNREHSFPKSWFNDNSPMDSDGFHIYPTDGYVNSRRSNYPFGECAGGQSFSSGSVKGLGKLGKSTFSGYSGTVFEPDDQYKGDFARSYFYMAACYNGRFSSFHSDMLAGNSYPCFTTWAINLLLKWHRQDPVSQKERDRNEAVYKRQRNRNPFIDHPELAEHIWGNQQSVGWNGQGGSTASPAFIEPVNGSTVDMGRTVLNNAVTRSVSVRGTNFTSNTTVGVTGSGFSASTSSLSASAVNSGTSVTITYKPGSASATSGTLTLTSGTATVKVSLTGSVVSGIPANNPTGIGQDAFTANWVNVGNSSTVYTLHVTQNGSELPGYPREMAPGATSYRVTGLESGATYVYWVTGMGLESNHVSVTTHGDFPELNVMPEEDLLFEAVPGTPSRAIAITVDAFNLEEDITVMVSKPFEVSSDRSSWSKRLTLDVDDDHFYLRVNSAEEGVFHTSVNVSSGDFLNDDLTAQANVSKGEQSFFESFEASLTAGYKCDNLNFDAASWTMDGAGVFEDTRVVHTGVHGVRFNASDGGSIVMTTAKRGGLGTVSLWTRLFDDEAAVLSVEYSADGGNSWHHAATVNPVAEWAETTAAVNVEGGDMRLRFTKLSGGRVALDDIRLTNHGSVGIDDVDSAPALCWEAYNLAGELAIESIGQEDVEAVVYGMDGIALYSGRVAAGTVVTMPLPAGVYIVVSGDDSRRVVIR